MTDLTPIIPKLSKLVPRLASESDGEIVATVRAIERTLKAAGSDWHDFTEALTKPPVVYKPPREELTYRDVAQYCRARSALLKPHEAKFVQQMCAELVFGGKPSPKQRQWLMSLYGKVGGEA